jgi:uracil-DNA glycosylase
MQPTRRKKMILEGLFLTGRDAELLSRMLSEIKTKAYEESETSLDDTKALDALVSRFRDATKPGQEKEAHRTHSSPSNKHLVLGTIIGHAKNV